MSQFSDLVQDAKLATKLDSESTIHTFLESSLVGGRRSRRREREEKWKRKRHLAIGISGTVWLEECAVNQDTRLRAVREIRKTGQGPKPIDYSRELEAIVKFSQQKFDGCFVKSSGWYENEDSLFIPMEYFVLGDLQKYICQPFPEGESQQITLQILEGLDFMHSNGFDHRDLKPQNVFVIAKSPEWWVKLGDFGLSKRVMEGLTGLQAFNSAPAFTAPELYKTMWEPDSNKETSTPNFNPEVDIWSVGVISYYLLTGKLPFDGQHDLLAYYNKESELPTESLTACQASDEALKFLKDILTPSPSDRLSARDALEHDWLAALLQESDPDDPAESQPPVDEKTIPPLQPRIPRSSQDVMLPGTINLTGTQVMLGPGTPLTLPPPHTQQSYHSLEATQQELISQHQQYHQNQVQQHQIMMTASQTNVEQSNIGNFGMNGDYKPPMNTAIDRLSALNLLSNVHPLHRPAADPSSLATAPYTESQITQSPPRPVPLRQLSSQITPTDMSTSEARETLPPYSRRRSDAAPIPVSDLELDLDLTDPRAETASDSRSRSSTIESPRGSIERHSSERRFDRFRRVSGSMLPRRHTPRSVDHGKKKDMESGAPPSPTGLNTIKGSETKGSGRKTKSQIMEVPGRPQFAEGLPLFPVRAKKV